MIGLYPIWGKILPSDNRLKVLLVSPLPPPAGGIANWSAAVLHETKALNNVELIHVDTAVRWRYEGDDIPAYIRIPGGSAQAIRDMIRVYRACRGSKPHVIHLCTSASLSVLKDLLILGLARIMGVRSVLHFRMGRLPEIIANNTLEWKFVRRAMMLADAVLLLDRKSEESTRAALPRIRAQRIPNPIDIRRIGEAAYRKEPKLTADTLPSVMYAGWVVPTKGVRELVDACVTIGNAPFELNLVGTVQDDYRRELEAVAARRGGGKWLKFHGVLGYAETMDAMSRALICVLPSYTEGFPNVVAEAMALGKPIIATRVGAIPEMLGDKESEPCGVLVAPRNVDELRSAIVHLLTNPEDRKVYGERAKLKALSLYSMERVIESYVRLWGSMKEQDGTRCAV